MTPVPKFGLCLFQLMLQKTRFMILEQVLKYLYLDAYLILQALLILLYT